MKYTYRSYGLPIIGVPTYEMRRIRACRRIKWKISSIYVNFYFILPLIIDLLLIYYFSCIWNSLMGKRLTATNIIFDEVATIYY